MGAEVALIAGLGGLAADTVGQIQSGNAAEAAGNANAKIALQNAKMAREQAAFDERRLRADAKQTIGSAKANYGSAGVTRSGSALAVLESSAATAELDALNIRNQGEAAARSYENEAVMARFEGKQGKRAAHLGAASSILKGGAKVADRYG